MKKIISLIFVFIIPFSFIYVQMPVTAKTVSSRTKAVRAYKKFLKKHKKYKKFSLIYLDNNKTPELLTQKVDDLDYVVSIYTYSNGKLKKKDSVVYLIEEPTKEFVYYKKTGVYISSFAADAYYWSYYYKYNKGKIKELNLSTERNVWEKSPSYYCKILNNDENNKETLTKEEFNKALKKYTNGKKSSAAKFYKNTKSGRKKHCK
ncbi:MAG: hypothetical protein IJ903_07720 [Ruminococcus sp.]|nr:hypothetical protein [Ruminococcus sp.]